MKYYSTEKYLSVAILPLVVSSDWTPTMYYYGTVTLSVALSDADQERFGLVPYTAEGADAQAEYGALYAAETRAGA